MRDKHVFISNIDNNCWDSSDGLQHETFSPGEKIYEVRGDVLTGEIEVIRLEVSEDTGRDDPYVRAKEIGTSCGANLYVEKSRIYRNEADIYSDVTTLIDSAIWEGACQAHDAFMKCKKLIRNLNAMREVYLEKKTIAQEPLDEKGGAECGLE